ncbi:MAG TPA: hypothetical protein VNR42_11445 [Solirubrobacteraceae bacterium]|nr:hypothetical protein [Solirubrobacteraceae bacterium]
MSNVTIRRAFDDLLQQGWQRKQIPSLDVEVIQREQPIAASGDISLITDEIQKQLSDAGISQAVTATHMVAPAAGQFDPQGGLYVQNLAASPSASELSTLFTVVFADAGSIASEGGTGPSDGPPIKPPGSSATTADKTAPAPPTPTDPAATIAAVLPAFPDPAPLWGYVEKAERSNLARGMISSLHTSRIDFARRSEWVVAPEMVLLDACPRAQREDLAMKMLEVRAAITTADDAARHAVANLAKANANLAQERVNLAKTSVELAVETLKHMKKWRRISDYGLWVLGFTTIFSFVAVAYVLAYLAPHGEISDVAIPIIIFVLALFAMSPAVLLLRERPLEGLDKWSPASGSGNGTETSSGVAATPTSSASTQPAAASSTPA